MQRSCVWRATRTRTLTLTHTRTLTRLVAYRLALDLFREVEQLAQGDLKDQLRRAAAATVRNLAEGANRFHPRDKAARFIVARAECGECEAALEMAEVVGFGRGRDLRQRADRVAAMLTGLIRRQQQQLTASS